MKMENFIRVVKALSDEKRLKIINLLLKNDFCVGALSRKMGISEAAVSQHLKVLRNAGVVKGEKRGYYTHYDVKRETLEETADAIRSIAEYKMLRKGCRQHLTGDHRYCANNNSGQQVKNKKE